MADKSEHQGRGSSYILHLTLHFQLHPSKTWFIQIFLPLTLHQKCEGQEMLQWMMGSIRDWLMSIFNADQVIHWSVCFLQTYHNAFLMRWTKINEMKERKQSIDREWTDQAGYWDQLNGKEKKDTQEKKETKEKNETKETKETKEKKATKETKKAESEDEIGKHGIKIWRRVHSRFGNRGVEMKMRRYKERRGIGRETMILFACLVGCLVGRVG